MPGPRGAARPGVPKEPKAVCVVEGPVASTSGRAHQHGLFGKRFPAHWGRLERSAEARPTVAWGRRPARRAGAAPPRIPRAPVLASPDAAPEGARTLTAAPLLEWVWLGFRARSGRIWYAAHRRWPSSPGSRGGRSAMREAAGRFQWTGFPHHRPSAGHPTSRRPVVGAPWAAAASFRRGRARDGDLAAKRPRSPLCGPRKTAW